MTGLLQPNQVITTRSGQACTVLDYLGGGGQGEVYRVRWGAGEFALKWYYPHAATDSQRLGLEEMIAGGAPSAHFLWPEDMADTPGVPGYGYIMRLRDPAFKSLFDLMAGSIDISALNLVNASIELTKAFRCLHTKGLCYRDISLGNAFIDPRTGAVRVCDNDNVATNKTSACGVGGTPGFMAPEMVCQGVHPSRETDFHALAVLLFYILFIAHPLAGKKMLGIHCWDAAAQKLLFGSEPVFIFDPRDPSNEAVDLDRDPTGEAGGTALAYWRMYPQVLRDTFLKAFTAGLRDPAARVTELEWLDTLSAVRNSIFRCSCGSPNYYDLELVRKGNGKAGRCWSCGSDLTLPYRIRIGRSVIMLNRDTKLSPHHLGAGDFDFAETVAEVTRHPLAFSVWGLRNLGREKWVATDPDGAVKDVEPGKSVPLVSHGKIHFGKVEGEVRL